MNSSFRFATLCFLILSATHFSAGAEAAKPGETAANDLATTAAAWLKSSGLSAAQLLDGTKSGLGAIVDLASTETAKPGAIQISTPPAMTKLESMAKKINQTGAIDSFKASLNAAAASVVPQTTPIMKESVAGLTLNDAMTLTSGAPDAATRLLRKASEPALRAKLLPLVSQAIAANGTAAKAKELAAKAGPMAAMVGVPSTSDLEGYLLTQVLDVSFGFVGKAEAAVRANPALLKNAIAAKVFAPAKK